MQVIMVRSYLLTIKNNAARHTDIAELSRALALARGALPDAKFHEDIGYEPDSIMRMHLHVMISTTNQISCKKYNKLLNHDSWQYHFQAVPIRDTPKVLSYVMKNPSAALNEEYCYQHWIQRKLKEIKIT